MSDIFSRFGNNYENERNRQAQENIERLSFQNNNAAADRDKQFEQRFEETRQRNERAQKIREQYGFNFNIDQYAAIGSALENGTIKEDQAYDLLAAQTILDNFKRLGIDLDFDKIRNNLPAYNEYIIGRPEGQSARTPKENLAAIRDSFAVAGSNMRKNFLGMQLSEARKYNNKELEKTILERIQNENKTVEEFSDYQKRNFFVEAGKFAAESSLYTTYVLAGGMLGGAPGAFLAGWSGATGQAYLGLDAAGVDHKIAGPLSIAAGAVNAAIESTLGNTAGLVGRVSGAATLQQAISKRAAAFISDKLHVSGVLLKMATGPVGRYLGESIGELSEEVFQEVADIISVELASFIQKEGVTLERDDYLARVANAGKAGFMASLFMGIPGLTIDTVGSIGSYKTLRVDADTIPSEQLFKERHMDSPLRGKMTDEEWSGELSKIHEGRQDIISAEQTRIAEGIKETKGLGDGYEEQKTNNETGEPIPMGELYRRQNGRLYSELDDGIFKLGDARVESKNNLDAHIKFHEKDGKVIVDEFHVRPDRDNQEYRREAWQEFTERFADQGVEFVWNPNTEAGINIRQDLINNNPYGENRGLNYYMETDAGNIDGARFRNRVIDNFRRHFPRMNNTGHAIMAAEWEHFAGMQGKSLEEYVNQEFGSLEKAFTGNPNIDIYAAAKEGHKIKGAVSFENLESDARAIIYLSENADLSTFIHEMGHIYRRRLQGDMLKQAEKLWGVKNGKWSVEQEERFTEDLERWRRDGAAPTPEMKSFFEKFAEFLKGIFNAISQREAVSPEIKEFFDNLYKGDNTGNRAENTSNRAENKGDRSEKSTYEKNKKFNEERPLLDKNNDGKSNLKPKQTGVSTAQELRDKAEKHIEELRSWVNSIAEKYGAKVIERPTNKNNPLPLKSADGIQRKLNDGDDITEILDVMGMTIVVSDIQTLVKITEELHSRNEVVRIKDRYKIPEKSGYRDILTNVQLSDGMIAEVQINTEQMLAAKKGDGHKIYEVERTLENEAKAGNLTEEEALTDKIILKDMSINYYDQAYQALLSESHFIAISRDIAWPSLYEEPNTLKREGESVLSKFTLNKLKDLELSANNSPEYTSPSMSTNSKSGSSKLGTSTLETGDVNLSSDLVEEETTELSNISAPSTISIEQKTNSVNSNLEKNSEENEKRIEKAKDVWEAADRVKGAEDQITLQTGEVLEGHYELGAAGISTPSVNPDADYTLSEGFPVNENGTSMNVGRDYTGGFSQNAAIRMASQFDQRGMGIIVDTNGITSSGNNRDISRRIAAKNGTDGKYIDYLKSRPERWGFTQEDIEKYEHPTVYFVVKAPAAYTPLYFDQFNRSGKKSVSPIETAIKMSYLIDDDMRNEFSAAMGNYDSITDLYEDTQAATEIYRSLMKRGIVSENSYPDYVETVSIKGKQQERITSSGREFLESVMLGGVLNEDSIRSLSIAADIRKRVVKGVAALVDNAALGEYGVIPEINQAVSIAVEIQTNKKKYKSITDYAAQTEMDMGQKISTDIEIELAGRLLEKTEYAFADMMAGLNAVLQEEARGQDDMFGGTSKDDILRRYLGIKAKVDEIRESNSKIIADESAPMVERVEAAMQNAGLARDEAGGTFFQIIGEMGAAALDRAEESTHRLDNLAVARKMEYKAIKETDPDGALDKAEILKIKHATGWERGADGKWRYEIPDIKLNESELIRMTEELDEETTLGKLVQNDDLFKAYPYIKDTVVRKVDARGGAAGWYDPQDSSINIVFTSFESGIIEKVLIHEIQHYIQSKEGFAEGGSPRYFKNQKTENKLDLLQSLESKGDRAWERIPHWLKNEARKINRNEDTDGKAMALIQEDEEAKAAWEEYQNAREEWKKTRDIPDSEFDGLTAYEQYHRLAGEVEARNVETRYERYGNYSTQDRYFLLEETEDVSREDQIFIERGLTLFQKAYHGSSELFNKFDNSYINSGYGEQAFGYGHYFSSKKEVAKWYGKEVNKEGKGHLYKAEIPDDNELLDWNKLYKKQSKVIQDILKPAADNFEKRFKLEAKGEHLYGWIPGVKNAREASKWLLEKGIKGIRYFDNKSPKEAGGGSYNYVIFDDNDINITQTLFQTATPTDTEEFKKWFGDSKVVDKNGNPKIVYHNTMRNFTAFNLSYVRRMVEIPAFFFAPESDPYCEYGDIEMPVYLSMKNPYKGNYSNYKGIKGGLTDNAFMEIRETLIADGYDGIIGEESDGTIYEYAVFFPEQIKSIYNRGTWNPKRKNTFFQLDNDIVESATEHDSWRGFRDSINKSETTEADNAWYRSIWNDARKIFANTLFQDDEESTSRAKELDKRFYKEADKKYVEEALKTMHGILNDKSLEPVQGEDGTEYNRIQRLQGRIRAELPYSSSITGMAAQVNSIGKLSSSQYDRLKNYIRNRTREFRSVFAEIMKQEDFLEDLAEIKDGEPAARLADPRSVKTDTMAKLREIAREIGDHVLQKEIESGQITMDDPRIAAFEKGQISEYEKASKALKTLETEIGEDFARMTNSTKRKMVSLYEKMLAAKEKLSGEKDKLNRMIEDGISITSAYQEQANLAKSDFDQAMKAFDDYTRAFGIEADVRESLARRDARSEERIKQRGLNKRRRVIAALKEIKRKLIRRITRNVSFENISYDHAIIIKTIQRIFEPSIIEGANKWIGGVQGPMLREIWSQWKTDEQFRERIIEDVGEKKANKLLAILNKSWDFVTTADKKTVIKLMPKADFIKDLGLEELIQENEESVQLDIDEKVINGQVHYIIGAELERKIKEALGPELYNRVQNKPLSEWTILEAEELARLVDLYTVEGRKELRAKKEAERIIYQQYRDKIIEGIEKAGLRIEDDNTPEEKERKEAEQKRVLSKYASGDKKNTFFNNFFDGNLRRFTTAMDGGRKGIFTSLLYWGENNAFNTRERQIAARRMLVDKAMKDNNITIDELYKEVSIPYFERLKEDSIFLDMGRVSNGKLTVDDLLYIVRGVRNEETRKAIMYGNLSNAKEREHYKGLSGNETLEDISAFGNVAHTRLMAILSFANSFFAKEENKKYLELEKVIGQDYDHHGERLNRAMIEIFNKPMWRVGDYVPMNRREQTGDENQNRVIEDLLGISGAGQKWVSKGWSEKRINISPYHQAPIELGLYKTWAQSVTDTEHFLAYAPLVRSLNFVFKGQDSRTVKQTINDRWGNAATKRIEDTIAEFANPNATRQRSELDKFVRALRGKTATAYLAWKTSGVLLQAVTSPWPYLQEISPLHYIPACLEVAAGFGKVNDFIREKSVFMNTRQFDPMIKIIKEQMENNKNPIMGKINKFNKLGMQGLEWIDWAAVAPGWLAKYREELGNVAKEQETEYQKLLDKYHGAEWTDALPTEESKVNRAFSEVMNEQQQDAEAVARADDMVRRLQPSSRAADIAPIFKNRNEIVSAVLQFQVSLNVIWQNLRYDLPLAVKEKQVGTIVGMVTGYVMAGICLGFLHDDDGEDEKKNRDWSAWLLYNALTQFTDSVPVIGSLVNSTSEQVITGKSKYWGSSGIFPSIEKALTGTSDLANAIREDNPDKQKQKFIKAAQKFTEAVGIGLGLPVSGTKELLRAAGIGDGDGKIELYPEALMGQRSKK